MEYADLEKRIERIKSKIEHFGEEGVCWPWKGSSTQAIQRVRRRHVIGEPPMMYVQTYRPYAMVRIKGKLMSASRLVYQFLRHDVVKDLPQGWKLVNTCGDSLCCNPEHWDHVIPGQRRTNKKPKLDNLSTTPPDPEDTLAQDCEDLLDQIFSSGGPSTLEGVLSHNYMIDFDRELIIKTLQKMGKGHLCK